MDRWKAETGRGREEKRRRSKKRKSQKKEDPSARKGRKVAKHCVFPMICGSGGSKSRLAKAAGAEPCGQMMDEKLHAVVARSTFASEKAKNTSRSDHFWKLRCRKSARRCGAKHMSKSKCTKHTRSGPLLEVEMSKKCTPLWREAHCEVKSVKTLAGSEHFWKLRYRKSARRCGAKYISKSKCENHHMLGPLLDVQMLFRVAGARDYAPCQKWAKREDFVAFPKTMAGVGHLKRICKDAFSVAGAVQETCSSELLGGPGADFLREVAFWSIRSSGLLRCFCVTGAALRMTGIPVSLFRGRRSTLDRWNGKIAKRIGTRPSALHSTFHFWRKSRRIASFLMLSSLKNEEVSQNCFVFDVVKNWGSLAELLRFQAYS